MPHPKQSDRSPRKLPIYKLKRNVTHRLALIVGVCCAVQFLRLHVLARGSLEAKFTATEFDAGSTVLDQFNNITGTFGLDERTALVAAKSDWRPLGAGCEGSTFTWNDRVIKTYRPQRSPPRNCLAWDMASVPSSKRTENPSQQTRWPTEIPASLIFGTAQGFLPVSDVFFGRSSPDQGAQWHLITPLVEGGTLQTLAKSVKQSSPDTEVSIQVLDTQFRPRFEELLVALQHLHSKGLCHDDMKPDNVFVDKASSGADGSWLLGDLGNVRHTSHPYHATTVWTRHNLPNCRANDALRVVKTYLQFLRLASENSTGSGSDFDMAFLEACEPWARLLWRAEEVGNELQIEDVLQWSMIEDNPASLPTSFSKLRPGIVQRMRSWLLLPFVGRQGVHGRSSALVLKISASEGWTRMLALTWSLGIPVGRC